MFLNLIGNGVQAMPDGGRLRVHLYEARERGNGRSGVRVSVHDTGVGIRGEHVKNIFEPFFSTKAAKGTGLGLWISQGIVQKYDGRIRFRSLRNNGSKCHVLFRILSIQDIPTFSKPRRGFSYRAATRSRKSMITRRPLILCVDDEDTPLLLRKIVLQKAGYDVVTASSATEALEITASQNVDLLLSDHLMPGMTGAELAQEVKERHPAILVVLLSGLNEIPPGAEAANLFISKLEGPDRLCQTQAAILKTKS